MESFDRIIQGAIKKAIFEQAYKSYAGEGKSTFTAAA